MLSCVFRCKTTYLILYRQKSVWLYRVTREYKSKGQFTHRELPLHISILAVGCYPLPAYRYI